MSIKKDYIAPILVLSLICLIISGALAFTNSYTEPIVANAAKLRTEEIRNGMIPGADDFELLEIDGLPVSVREVYRSANGVGYVIVVVTNGYGGDMRIIIGVSPDGTIIQSKVLEHSETKGLGSIIEEASFANQFNGLNESVSFTVDAITGATISSNAYAKAISDALEAFEIVASG